MYKLITKNVLNALINPKFYFSIIIGSILGLYNAFKLLEFSIDIKEPLNVFEVWIYSSSSAAASSLSFLGILFFLSQLPFEKNETLELIRMTKIKWAGYKIIYSFLIINIYYMVIFIVGITIILCNSFCGNVWSYPIYVLTFGDSVIRNKLGLILSIENIIYSFSPTKAVVISFILTVMYSMIMILLNIIINTAKINGIAITATVHSFGYYFANYLPRYSKISFVSHSILNSHFFSIQHSNDYYPTLRSSFVLFVIILLIVITFFLILAKRNDCIGIRGNEYEV